jgi:hypothetical protein
MRVIILILIVLNFSYFEANGQVVSEAPSYDTHGVVWSGGLFKSWLKDNYVGFNKIGSTVTPIFSEQKKMGFAIHSHYMYKPTEWLGFGVHLGIGLDVTSFIEAPVVLFGGSVSFGSAHQFIIQVGWADGKRKKVPGGLKDELLNTNYSEIPIIYEQIELNTGFYLGIGYRLF